MRKAVAGFLVVPLLGFPLFAGTLVLVDTLLGEGLFLYQLTYEQRALAEGFVGDFLRALPLSYVAAVLLNAMALVAARWRGGEAARPVMVGAGAALGLTLGSVLSGSPAHAESLLLAVTGAVFAWLLSLPMGWYFAARAETQP